MLGSKLRIKICERDSCLGNSKRLGSLECQMKLPTQRELGLQVGEIKKELHVDRRPKMQPSENDRDLTWA